MTRDESLQRLEHELGVLLRRARRIVAHRAAEVHPDLQAGAYLMLAYVRRHGPLRASELCEQFDLDKAAVSRRVQHLQDLGLVARAPDPQDGRATLVTVSDQGAERMARVSAERRRGMAERLADWSLAELDDLVEVLGRYNDALG